MKFTLLFRMAGVSSKWEIVGETRVRSRLRSWVEGEPKWREAIAITKDGEIAFSFSRFKDEKGKWQVAMLECEWGGRTRDHS